MARPLRSIPVRPAALLIAGLIVTALVPAASPRTTAAASGSVVFSDGFETTLSAWSSSVANGGWAYTSASSTASGSQGLRIGETATSGSVAQLRRSLSSSVPDLTAEASFRIRTEGASGSNVPLVVLRRSDGTEIVRLYRQNATGGQVWVALNRSTYVKASATLALGTWARLGLRVTIAGGATDAVTVTMGDQPILALTGRDLGDNWVRTVQLGQEVGAQAFDEDVDDVVLTVPGTTGTTSTPTPTPTVTVAPTSAPSATPAPSASPTPAPSAAPTSAVVVAVGDIHSDGYDAESIATKNLTASIDPAAVLGLGDYQYQYGTCDRFMSASRFDSDWGSQLWRVYGTLGPTHDYQSGGTGSRADLYLSGRCAGRATVSAGAKAAGGTQTWTSAYSFDLAGWHIVQLPSTCNDYAGSACSVSSVNTWLAADLAAHPSQCTLAFTHEPYWSSPTSTHGRTTALRPWIQTLYDAGAEIVLGGHQHMYERFAPQSPSDALDTARGIVQVIAGSGGIGFYPRTGVAANSAAYQASTYGVLKLTLRQGAADLAFVPVAGSTWTDRTTVTCH